MTARPDQQDSQKGLFPTSAVGNTPVFTSTGGGLLNVSNFRSRHFTPAVKAAGLGHVRIHDLRHSAISWWIHQGGPQRNQRHDLVRRMDR